MNPASLRRQFFFIASLFLVSSSIKAQKILDPCFLSIKKPGYFYGTDSVFNLCQCGNYYKASNMLEWDGDEWLGRLELAEVDLPPPGDGCNIRAMWMGYPEWTMSGEAFGLKLDKGMETGKSYTYTFTYASDGKGGNGHFAPKVYVYHGSYPNLSDSYSIWRLPEAGYSWTTNSITIVGGVGIFDANWIILRADVSSGLVLSGCSVENAIAKIDAPEGTLCKGDAVTLHAVAGTKYQYLWSTGETSQEITVLESGTYTLDITNYSCTSSDNATINFTDCDVRLDMPNIFTPNDDAYNPVFKPREHNYIATGRLIIFNRWGDKIFTGDLFEGWNGMTGKTEASTGVYYYDVFYTDEAGGNHRKRGAVTLTK